jgi:hypothetical protein
MAYTTTVVTEFDEQLFNQCFTDYYDVLLESYVEPLDTFRSNHTELRDAIFNMWQRILSHPTAVQYKITDTTTNQDLGYSVGVIRREHRFDEGGSLKVIQSMYCNDQTNSREWVLDYIHSTFCDQEKSIATQLNTVRWNYKIRSTAWEAQLVGSGLKRARAFRHDGESFVNSINVSDSFITQSALFLSPWGWPEWKYEQ